MANAYQIQLRRSASTAMSTRAPADGELWYSTDDKQVVVGDGATLGGNPITNGKRIILNDGITVSSAATTGFAEIYIDSADGDLKIRFGDGVTKTIVTDTT